MQTLEADSPGRPIDRYRLRWGAFWRYAGPKLSLPRLKSVADVEALSDRTFLCMPPSFIKSFNRSLATLAGRGFVRERMTSPPRFSPEWANPNERMDEGSIWSGTSWLQALTLWTGWECDTLAFLRLLQFDHAIRKRPRHFFRIYAAFSKGWHSQVRFKAVRALPLNFKCRYVAFPDVRFPVNVLALWVPRGCRSKTTLPPGAVRLPSYFYDALSAGHAPYGYSFTEDMFFVDPTEPSNDNDRLRWQDGGSEAPDGGNLDDEEWLPSEDIIPF